MIEHILGDINDNESTFKFLSTGAIIQVVSTTKTDTWSGSTTGSWYDITGLNVTITPSSTS